MSHTIVTTGTEDNYFGIGTETHISVTPHRGHSGSWWVLVAESVRVAAVAPCLRTDKQFQLMHRALEDAQVGFSQPLPHLPLHSTLFQSREEDAVHLSSQLQEYLAALHVHPEASMRAPYLEFVMPTSDGVVGMDIVQQGNGHGTDTPHEPVIVKSRSHASNLAAGDETLPPSKSACTRVTLSWSDEDGDHAVELPVLTPAHGMGKKVIDVRSLGSRTPFFTHDPGFLSTSSCASAITYIDGDAGVLLHRGYPIEMLAKSCTFPEVAYLLIEGELPSDSAHTAFEVELKRHAMVHEKLKTFFQGFKGDAHPMAIMVGVVGALSAFYPEAMDIGSPSQRRASALHLIAKMPTIAAISFKTAIGEPPVYPRNDLSFAANFLHMMFATPCEPYAVHPVHARALETIFVLHADHEQNASTSTVRIASSSQANPFACIAAGIACLWGPAHGGANEAVLRMLKQIGAAERIPEFIAKAKDKSDPFRLMGFGHRVYRNHDPRATLMRQVCLEVLATVPHTPDLTLAQELEQAALSDEYFVSRKLYPNVDFYSGIVLRALGIPTDMFTVIFAVSRTAGWLAQWNESFADQGQRISRPRQLYTGKAARDFVPLSQRPEKKQKR